MGLVRPEADQHVSIRDLAQKDDVPNRRGKVAIVRGRLAREPNHPKGTLIQLQDGELSVVSDSVSDVAAELLQTYLIVVLEVLRYL